MIGVLVPGRSYTAMNRSDGSDFGGLDETVISGSTSSAATTAAITAGKLTTNPALQFVAQSPQANRETYLPLP
jgi:hypothetical protein